MTQEDVFRSAEGGFVFGFALPHEEGNLENFRVVNLEAKENDDASKLCGRIIEALGHKPERVLWRRGKQLTQLFDSYIERDFIFVIVIAASHLMNPRTLYDLKVMQEFSSEPYPKSRPGIVLLGNPDRLGVLVKKHEGVYMRASSLPVHGLRLVKW
jgi:hypothetical protein